MFVLVQPFVFDTELFGQSPLGIEKLPADPTDKIKAL